MLWGDLAEAAGRARAGRRCTRPRPTSAWSATRSAAGSAGTPARLGLQCNAVTAVEVVLADGTFVRATADTDAELFWALRGGGAPLGVVTALEFDLLPLETVVAGFLAWDWTAVERVLPAWVAWCARRPRGGDHRRSGCSTCPTPTPLPAELRGRRLVVIDGAVLGDDAAAAEVLAPLRALRPEIDTVDAGAGGRRWSACTSSPRARPRRTRAARWSSDLPDAAIAAVIDAAGPGSGTGLTVAELRQLGGALSRPDPAAARCPASTGVPRTRPRAGRRTRRAGRSSAPTRPGFLAARRAVGDRPAVPADARRPHRHPQGVPADVHARLSAVRRAVDPRRALPRAARDPEPRLRAVTAADGLKIAASARQGSGARFLHDQHPTWRTP